METIMNGKSPKYGDFYFRSIAILLACHFIVTFGMQMSFFEFMVSPDYWKAMLGSAVIASVLVAVVNKVCVLLDRKFDWFEAALARTGLQLFWGWVMPSILAFLLAAVYFLIRRTNIFETEYLRIDYPVIVILILLINIYYLGYYLVDHAIRARREAMTNQEEVSRLAEELERERNAVKDAPPVIREPEAGEQKAYYLVSKATRNIPLAVDSIAYFFREDEVNYLLTVGGEKYMITETLDAVQLQMDERLFFRVNRQFLVNRQAMDYYEPLENYKLELFVKPAYTKDRIVISQKTVKRFKEWIGK